MGASSPSLSHIASELPGFHPQAALARIQAREEAGFVSCGDAEISGEASFGPGTVGTWRQGRRRQRDANGLTPTQKRVFDHVQARGLDGCRSYTDIAEHVGCCRRVVAHTFSALARQGLVQYDRRAHRYVAVLP